MWRIADADSEVVIFGSFHLLPADVKWRTPAFEDAMARTETTMLEADVTSPEAQGKMGALVQKYGFNEPGVTLSGLLGPDRAKRFAEVAGKYGAPMAAIENYRPWFAILSLSVVAMQQAGYSPDSGVEKVVLAEAGKQGDALDFFESAEDQILALTKLDGDDMLANVDLTLDQLEDFGAYSKKMLNAWRTGDGAAIEAMMIEGIRESSSDAFDALILDRNRNWAKRVDAIMKGEGDYFMAVGVGHLFGKDSLIDLLEKQGYAVSRIQ